MPSGVVKWFNAAKDYGFIKPGDGGIDVFVHGDALRASGLATLTEGQAVTYDAAIDRGKPAAVAISILPAAAPPPLTR